MPLRAHHPALPMTTGRRAWLLGIALGLALAAALVGAIGLRSRPGSAPVVPPSAASPTATPPGSQTTGVPATVALSKSSGMTITKHGTVVEGRDISGRVLIQADNVTIRNSRIRAATYYVVEVADGVHGARLEDVEIDGLGTRGLEGSNGVLGRADILRADIHGVENGVQPSSGSTIKDSWIHDLAAPGDPHYDGVQIDGARNDITISGNLIDLREHTQTAAVMINNYFGSSTRIRVNDNWLRGGGWTVHCDGRFDGGSIGTVTISGNRIGHGRWGEIASDRCSPTVKDNVDDVSGEPLPAAGQ